MNDIEVTIRGNVATEPRSVTFDDGNQVTSFRLASNARRYDPLKRAWVDAGATYLQVNCRRALSENAFRSLMIGQPILVQGWLRTRSWEKDGKSGWTIQVEAFGLGHDLAWGTSSFTRVNRVQSITSQEEESANVMAAMVEEDARHQAERPWEHGVPVGVDPETGEIDGDYDEVDDVEAPEPLAAAV